MTRFTRTLLPALILIAASAGATQASPTLPLPPPMRMGQDAVLMVTGEGVVSKQPDQAELSLEIVTDDKNATVSTSKNNDVQNALKARLSFLRCDGCDALRQTDYRIENIPFPPKNLPPEQRQARYGYVTTRSLTVTITPIALAGRVVDAANAAGVTTIGEMRFVIKDRRGAYMSALSAAMTDARRQADALAAAGGLQILRVRTVSTSYASAPPTAPMMEMMRMPAAAAAPMTPTEILPSGPLEVGAHVTVTYAVK